MSPWMSLYFRYTTYQVAHANRIVNFRTLHDTVGSGPPYPRISLVAFTINRRRNSEIFRKLAALFRPPYTWL